MPMKCCCLVTPARARIFNSHLWHGGTTNRSKAPRRGLHGAFVRREHQQQTVQRDYLSPATVSRLTVAERFLLDV